MSNEPTTEAGRALAADKRLAALMRPGQHRSLVHNIVVIEEQALAASRAETADLRLLLDVAEEAATQARAETAAAVAALAKVLPYARCSEGLTTSEWDECRATLDEARALLAQSPAASDEEQK